MKNINDYKIIYYYSFDDGCFLATIPELEGCISDGETPKDAITNTRQLAKEWVDIAKEQKWVIPEPTTISFPNGEQLHLMDIVAYILEKTDKITTKALQKLSYYCNAWSCGWYGKPLFPETFQAWSGGPMNPELFQLHKGSRIFAPLLLSEYSVQELSFDQKKFVDKIIKVYGEIDPDELGEMSHKEDPWIKARNGLSDKDPSTQIISEKNMIEYYGQALL